MSRVERQKEQKEKEKKKGGIGAWIYRLIILALLGVMGFSGYQLWKIYSEYHEGTVIYNDLADEVGAGKSSGVDNTKLHLDWDKLLESCEDVKGWIRCKDTVINYPIVQGENNDEYLYRTITGEYNSKGSIFIDYLVKKPFEDFNTILYGHRMKDGSMFKPLVNYFDSDGVDYYKEHPTMEIYTPTKNFTLEIFACARIDGTDAEWYRTDFQDNGESTGEELKMQYLNRVFEANELQADTSHVSIGDDDIIVTMSTCTAELDEYRLVVWGKLVPEEAE